MTLWSFYFGGTAMPYPMLEDTLKPIIDELRESIPDRLDGVPELDWRAFYFHDMIHHATGRIREALTTACIDLLD